MSVIFVNSFKVDDKVKFQGREWHVKEIIWPPRIPSILIQRPQYLLAASYPKHRARKGGRRTMGRTFTLQSADKLVKVNDD